MTTAAHLRKQIRDWNWTFWGQWTLANAIAGAAAFWSINHIYDQFWSLIVNFSGIIGKTFTMALFGALFGLMLGAAQWLTLRHKIRNARAWIMATMFACALMWAIPWSMHSMLEYTLSGFLLGFLQWLVFRRYYQGVSWWIVVSGLSWFAAKSASQWILQSPLPQLVPIAPQMVGAICQGLVYGALSGAVLTYFFQVLRKILRPRKLSAPSMQVFVASWVVMHAVGWGVGFGSFGHFLRDAFIAQFGLPSHVIADKAVLEILAASTIWFVLWRQWFRASLWWVVWSGIGAAVGMFVWIRLDVEHATGILLYGTIVGFFQWFVLSQRVSGFFAWMLTRSLAWGVSLVVVGYVGRQLNANIGWTSGGMVYGGLTGVFLFLRMRRALPALQTERAKELRQNYPSLNASAVVLAILLGTLAASPAAAFDMRKYAAKHAAQGQETFIRQFPYATYLQQVQFTDFAQLQRDRRLLWQTFGDGDEFLYYLGEHFITYYPVQLATLTDSIAIGEAYLAEKKSLGINSAINQIYHIIGYYILGRVAQKLKDEIRRGKFDPSDAQNAQILQRLEQNRVYVTIERGTLQNLIYNLKQGKWDYIFNRVWLKSKEVEQKTTVKYAALLGSDFFDEFYPMQPKTLNIPATESRFQLSASRRYYPLKQGSGHALNVFAIQDKRRQAVIGHAVWLRRPEMKATYFAYRNVSAKMRAWASKNRKTLALATTGGFTNVDKKPEGLTVEQGTIVNAVLMPDRDGLVIVHDSGGISVINLKRDTIKLSLGAQKVLTIKNPLRSLIAYSKLLDWCRTHNATLFQTQLLAFSDRLLIDVNKAKGQLRERRLIALARDRKSSELHHILFDIPTPHNLALIAGDIFDFVRSRDKKVEALLNLDVGSYNILHVYDQRGNVISNPKGPVQIGNATNLIVYTR